jgi:MinD-like ATPase involved in chromosome partitioning or flagellar assembly
MGKIVAVHSYRGGTGKSNVTANLGATLALQGRRIGIVDTDLQSPGIHVLFGFDEDRMDRSLNHYLWGECAIQDAAYDVSATLRQPPEAAGAATVYLIPSSSRTDDIARILRQGYDVGLLNDGFHELVDRLHLDYLFIDTHPGLNEETLLSMTIADLLLILFRPDRQDYQGTAVTVDVARRLEVAEMLLVVNKVLTSLDQESLRQQAEQTYSVPVAGILPLSEDVVRLASGDIFCICYPDHPWAQQVRAIAGRIGV